MPSSTEKGRGRERLGTPSRREVGEAEIRQGKGFSWSTTTGGAREERAGGGSEQEVARAEGGAGGGLMGNALRNLEKSMVIVIFASEI
jgi:uncharacterized protein YcfJ